MTPEPSVHRRGPTHLPDVHEEATNLISFDAQEFMAAHKGVPDTQPIPHLSDMHRDHAVVDERTDLMTPEELFADVGGLVDTAGGEPLVGPAPLYDDEARHRGSGSDSRSLSEIDFDLE